MNGGTAIGAVFAMFTAIDNVSTVIANMANNVQTAYTNLTDSAAGMGRAVSQTNALINQFSGAALAQQAAVVAGAYDAVGGAAVLTVAQQQQVNQVMEDYIAKAQLLGQEVPPQYQAIADATHTAATETVGWSDALTTMTPLLESLGVITSVGGLAEAAKSAVDLGESLEDLSTATGIGIEGLQQLQYAAAPFGVDIDSLAHSIDQMQKNVETGSPA